MADINILRQIATTQKSETQEEEGAIDLVSQKSMEEIDNFLLYSQDMEPSKRYVKLENIIKTLNITPSNREEIYDTLDALHPVSKKRSKEQRREKWINSVNKISNDIDRESKIQNDFNSLPLELLPEAQNRFMSLQKKGANQEFEQSRISQVLDASNILDQNKWEDLDIEVSTESHVRNFLKLYGSGMTDDIYIVNGQLSFPGPNGDQPAYVLPESQDIHDNFILWNDIAPKARDKFSKIQEKGRKVKQQRKQDSLMSIYDNRDKIPEDIIPSLTLDVALTQKSPAKFLRRAISERVEASMKRGEISSYKDIVTNYIMEQNKIESILIERMKANGITDFS